MPNFCTNCGAKLRKDANFCTNCGTKVVKSNIKQHNPSSIYFSDRTEKKYAKMELERIVGGKSLHNSIFVTALLENDLDIAFTGRAIRRQVEKEIDSGQIRVEDVQSRVNQLIQEYKIENEEKKKKLETINEIFESAEIKSDISKNNIGKMQVIFIRNRLKNKLFNKKENMSEEEIKYFIKTEIERTVKEQAKARMAKEKAEKERIAKEREMRRKEMEKTERTSGGYCGFSCRHFYEEFFDSGGGITGDFESDGYFEYYCRLFGRYVNPGHFCEYYE